MKSVCEKERAQMSFLWDSHICWFFFLMTVKFMQSHFSSHFLYTPFCCSPSVLPPFTHLDLTVWVPSVKDDTTVGSILTSWDWAWHPGSLCLLDNLIMAVLIRLSVLPVLSIHIITHVLVSLFVQMYLLFFLFFKSKSISIKMPFFFTHAQYSIMLLNRPNHLKYCARTASWSSYAV